jgi:hypothetical protein
MTTVDVSIEEIRTGKRLYLHNGLWGPATAVLHAFGQACQDGRISSSTWNVAEINEVTTGAVVRRGLDAITELHWKQTWDKDDRKRVAAFRRGLRDDAEYEIHALEV